ncbi:MAG: hypothetical protein J7K30_14630 [Deltaproteobacteria bacterium]|jgi:hypothetical protein|nr:hypothetical protein [Deltaproteobacteria bacterium]
MTTGHYTCKDYREEMMLLGLKKRLNNTDLPENERRLIKKQIEKIEKKMQFD